MIWAIIIPLMAIISIVLFWMVFKNSPSKFENLAINKLGYEQALKRSEVIRTIYSLLIFAFVGGLIDYFEYQGWAKTYQGVLSFGYGYLVLSIFLLFGINDIYFYLSHRFLHWKPIFKKVHFMHHQSHTPNPFSAFSFHPLEGFIQIGFLPIIILILPLNNYVLFGFIVFLMLMSVYGHSGYELRPKKAKVFEIFNNSIHHNQHHRYVHYNFGLYLNLWDQIFKTNHPEYEEETTFYKNRIS
ncbi:sterol desaturase family protein [Portibacter lacus]|uniref:Sterol desaturase n=1 Tax=Portibacter lacus TaxID=1099794 RepID=A0AA37SVY5_9BACT|nr:sterol desaturase family protein [Portibacter lacus]GLR19881.1 sterol desaturase [Portibacter lacus]